MEKTVPMEGFSAAGVFGHFMNAWLFNYSPLKELIEDSVRYSTSKFFSVVCKIISIKNNFTRTYHPQANGQVKRYRRTILAALPTYLADHPRDWDL